MTKTCFHIYKRSSPILRRSGSLRTVPKFPFGFSHPKGYSISNGIMNYPPHKPSMKDALIIANSSFLPLINIKK